MFFQTLALIFCLSLSFSSRANIIGSDDRVPMLSDSMPWSAIGRLQIGESGICTATLIARDLILTAAHCLIDAQTRQLHHLSQDVIFAPSYRHGRSDHHAKVTQVWVGTYNTREELDKDYAFARIDRPLGDIYGTLEITNYDGKLLSELGPKLVSLPGYSFDFHGAQTAGVHMNCSIRDLVQETLIAHDCDMRPGASGGPMLSFQGHKAVIVGINIAERNFIIAVSRILGRPLDYNTRTSANYAVPTERLMSLYNLLTNDISGRRRH